jgi:prepilin-type N-terminal cleavage/methylation domain-containing protein
MMLRIGNRGFTLIEVMIATVILAVGILFIYEAFFISIDLYNYCSDYMKVSYFPDEKIWQAQDSLARSGNPGDIEKEGELVVNNKSFFWYLAIDAIDEPAGLYKINMSLYWRSGKRNINLARTAYAIYDKEI